MFHRSFTCHRAGTLLLWVMLGATPAFAQTELSLAEAERLALEQAPWYAHHQSNVRAAAERTVSEGRLPDPQMTVGALNVPTDSFSLDQEDMTMLMVGVRQAFPPGDTLAVRTRRAGHELNREQARLTLEERNLRREVRRTWLELYYATAALDVVARTRPLFERQLQSAEGRYRAAQDTQQAVLQARQALARLREREHTLRAARTRAQAMLARWIGEAASRPLPAALPAIDAPLRAFTPEQHPDWLAAQAGLDVMRAEVDMARQEYRPGIMLDLSYGFRRTSPAGMERPDMLTAMVTFDMPIFRAKRQDRRLAESQARETGARHEIEDRRRDLVSQYESARAEHDALLDRVRLFEEQILPYARREAQVTVAGFARDQAMLRESQIKAFDVELELVRLRVELARARADLRYFIGEPQS